MRLLITTDTVGGVWSFTSELIGPLLEQGHAIHLVSFGREPSASHCDDIARLTLSCHLDRSEAKWRDPRYSAATQSPSHRFTYTATNIPLEWMQHNEEAFTAGQSTLLAILPNFRPDLILSSQLCFGALTTNIPVIVVAHSDVLSWANACRNGTLDPSPWLDRYIDLVQQGLYNARAVIAPTHWMGEALAQHFTLPHGFGIIPNGVAITSSSARTPRKLQAITAGRLWDEAKGLTTLHGIELPMPLLVAGEDTFSTEFTLAWPPQIIPLGSLPRQSLHQYFRESAIYLCTSLYEPFGLAPVEAALRGCAVVCRDIPSLREVWGDHALYFSDRASLTAVLNTLASDPKALHIAQQHAQTRAQHFTPERMADSYLDLFQSILPLQVTQHVA